MPASFPPPNAASTASPEHCRKLLRFRISLRVSHLRLQKNGSDCESATKSTTTRFVAKVQCTTFCATRKEFISVLCVCVIFHVFISGQPPITSTCTHAHAHAVTYYVSACARAPSKSLTTGGGRTDETTRRQQHRRSRKLSRDCAGGMSARIKRFGMSIVLKDVKLESFLRLAWRNGGGGSSCDALYRL